MTSVDRIRIRIRTSRTVRISIGASSGAFRGRNVDLIVAIVVHGPPNVPALNSVV